MKKRVHIMLEDDTLQKVRNEAKDKSISVSAICRQKIEETMKSKPKGLTDRYTKSTK